MNWLHPSQGSIAGIPRGLLLRLGWSTSSFGILQVLRLVNNVMLARLLSPSIMGLASLIFAIRTGAEMLSDLGANQNIVRHKKGTDPEFYNTVWTLQVVRGLILATIISLSAGYFAAFFEEPQIAVLLPVLSLAFVFHGFQSISRALLQKQVKVVRVDIQEFVVVCITFAVQISLAALTGSIWAIVIGGLVSSAGMLISTYVLIPGIRHRFEFNRLYFREVLGFSKWIFVATALYFFAWNFDRFYFAKQISLAQLGLFTVARSYADLAITATTRLASRLLFPTVAGMKESHFAARQKLLKGRRFLLLGGAIAMGLVVACSDFIIAILYDDRYADAARILPILLVGVWFAILATINEQIVMGKLNPSYTAYGNATKLATLLIGVPIVFINYGFTFALLVLVAGEVVRYVTLWAFSRRQHLGFGRDDLALTVLFVIAIFGFRKVLTLMGIAEGIFELFPVLPEFVSLFR